MFRISQLLVVCLPRGDLSLTRQTRPNRRFNLEMLSTSLLLTHELQLDMIAAVFVVAQTAVVFSFAG